MYINPLNPGTAATILSWEGLGTARVKLTFKNVCASRLWYVGHCSDILHGGAGEDLPDVLGIALMEPTGSNLVDITSTVRKPATIGPCGVKTGYKIM